jgi:glutaminyl-peptide cyclotransferase
MRRPHLPSLVFALTLLVGGVACGDSGSGSSPPTAQPAPSSPQQLRVRVIRALPHDPRAFTQGLVIHAGAFYESTGMQGQSTLRQVEIDSGKVLRRLDLDRNLFGEGLAQVGDRLVQLTWTTQKALVYEILTFRRVGELTYAGEGWGLCFDDQHLVMSNGSDRLTFRDPNTFAVVRELPVKRGAQPVHRLNELECVGDTVYANVWTSDMIVAIDPVSGRVTAEIDASGLLTPEEDRGTDVLNGIAYDKRSGHFFLTGKYWPKVFEVEFVAR